MPFCAEEIQDAAIVCKHCHRDLTPPKAKSWGWRHAILLLVLVLLVGAWLASGSKEYAAFEIRRAAFHRECDEFVGKTTNEINVDQAAVVKDIYTRYAAGDGFKQIAHALNAKQLPSPRPQRGRPAGWEPSTVRTVLKRSLYRGMAVAAAGGDIPALVKQLQDRDRELKAIDAKLAKPVVFPDRDVLEAALRLREGQWRDVLRGPHIQQARLVLQYLVDLPIQILHSRPKYIKKGDTRGTENIGKWRAQTKPGGLLVGLIQSVASLMPASWNQIAAWLDQIDRLRRAA